VVWWFRREHRGWSDKEVKCLTLPLTKKKKPSIYHFKLGEGGAIQWGNYKTSNYNKFHTDKVESGL
jgi:hypothetical protein